MKPFLALAAASLALFSTLGEAQLPPGVTPEIINKALPEEGAPKAERGAYAVTTEPAFGNAGLVVYRPANLDSFPKKDTLPVVLWGNGGCAINVGRHAGFIETIASHGFLVISTAAIAPATPAPPATAANLVAGMEWAEQENKRTGSPLAGKIELKKIAVMGQSCGGRLALELAADPRVGTIGVFAAGFQGEQMAAVAQIHGPVLLINGGEPDFMMGPSKATFDAIDKVPVFYGSRYGAGHSSTVYHAGGGEFANVATNWVLWQFKKDKQASKMFVGKKCGLCTNKEWSVAQKRMKR